MKKIFKYTSWPRRQDNTLMFSNTVDAFFYASQIFEDHLLVIEIKTQLSLIRKGFWKERDSKKPNLNYLFSIVFRMQFHRECLEEVERLQKDGGV